MVDAHGAIVPGEYCAGWIKRGPSGVIGTNKKDATETAELAARGRRGGAAHDAGRPDPADHRAARVRAPPEAVEYAGWEAIDSHERGRGEPHGRPRVKLCSWDELLHHGRRTSTV